jgi:hypothetical protein
LDYDFTIKETFNVITSGFVSYKIWPQPHSFPAGSGLATGGTSTNDAKALFEVTGSYREFSSGFNVLSGVIDTTRLENGLYTLNVEMTDYAGNVGLQQYFVYVVNPLQYVNVTIADYDEQVLALNFSADLISSGAFAASDLTVSIFRTSGNSTVSTQNITIQNLSVINDSNSNTRTILVKIITSGPSDQFYFGSGDRISVRIEASGIDKLFAKLTNEAILVPTPSTRTLGSDWPSAPTVYSLNHPVYGEYPYIQADLQPGLTVFSSKIGGLGSGITVSGVSIVSGTGAAAGALVEGSGFIFSDITKFITISRDSLPSTLTGDYVLTITLSDASTLTWTIKEYDSFNGILYLG